MWRKYKKHLNKWSADVKLKHLSNKHIATEEKTKNTVFTLYMTQNPSSFYSKIPTFTWHLFEQAGVYFVIQIIREKKIMRNEFIINFSKSLKYFFFLNLSFRMEKLQMQMMCSNLNNWNSISKKVHFYWTLKITKYMSFDLGSILTLVFKVFPEPTLSHLNRKQHLKTHCWHNGVLLIKWKKRLNVLTKS
jgi:hypothetical protein